MITTVNKIPTSDGEKSIPEIFNWLMYGSYAANRDLGMSHESLIKYGIGNDKMKIKYEKT